jgi:hypothetical protein
MKPATSTTLPCSGNGLIYTEEADLGLPIGCECHQCYEGNQCEVLQDNCVIGGPAEATLSLEWWQRHDAELRVNISATYHMGYLQVQSINRHDILLIVLPTIWATCRYSLLIDTTFY